jgi:hypothetical protein
VRSDSDVAVQDLQSEISVSLSVMINNSQTGSDADIARLASPVLPG